MSLFWISGVVFILLLYILCFALGKAAAIGDRQAGTSRDTER